MKKLRSVLAFMLTLAVILSILCVPALAAGVRNPEAYLPYSPYAAYGYPNCYCSFGDSIPAGFDKYEHSDIVGYQPTPETAYPSIVAKATNTYHCPFSFIGFRSSELLRSLGGDPGEFDFFGQTRFYWMVDENGYCNYWDTIIKDAVAASSLITVNIGNNDILTAPLANAAVDVLEAGNKWAENEAAIAAAIESGDLTDSAAKLFSLMNKLGYYKEYIPAVLAQMNMGLDNLKVNFPQIIEKLRSVNQTGQIVVVGMYNPYRSMTLTDKDMIKVGKLGDLLVNTINEFYKSNAEELGYIYVDVTGTETFADVNGMALQNGLGEDAHPTEKGHAFMAKRILDEIPVILPFTDVSGDAWYNDAVDYCYRNSLMLGVDETTFAPNDLMTRAMAVTVIYRIAGSPEVEGTLPFNDVDEGSWYYDALKWAYQNNIVKGYSSTKFAPNSNVLRQDFVAMLYRFAEANGYVNGNSLNLLEKFGFKDAASVASYAKEAMSWALKNGIINGVSSSSVDPLGRLTRAQCAALIMRFDNNIYSA